MFKVSGKLLPKLFWLVLFLSFVAWLFALVVLSDNQQLDIFYIHFKDFWGDAMNPTGMVSGLDPYHDEKTGIWNANYPPLAYICFYILARVSNVSPDYLQYYHQPVWTMLFIIILFIVLILLYSICVKELSDFSNLDSAMIALTLCVSYPMLHVIERGNILIVSVLTTAVFVFFYDSSNKIEKELALICLAVATGLKLSPVIFSILLLSNKDYKSALRLLIYSFILLSVPFLFLNDGIANVLLMIDNIKLWVLHHVGYTNIHGTGLVASYMKYLKFFFGVSGLSDKAYMILTILRYEFSFILLLGSFYLTEKWKKVLNITLILMILPAASHTYNVLYMIPFTILFLQSLQPEKTSLKKIIVFICLIMIYFVYRCDLSVFFNFNFAIPMLMIIGTFNSIQALKPRLLLE